MPTKSGSVDARPWGNVTQVARDEGLSIEEVIAQFLVGERRARWRPLEGKLFQSLSPDDFPNELRTPVVVRVEAEPQSAWVARGSRIEIRLILSSIVTVTANQFTPRCPTLMLHSGYDANYVGGSGTNTLRFECTLDEEVFSKERKLQYFRILDIKSHGATIRDVMGKTANLASAMTRLSPNFNVPTSKFWCDIPATIEPPTCFDLCEGVIYADGKLCGKDVEFEWRHSRRAAVDLSSAQSIPEANSPSTTTKPRTRQKSKGGAPPGHDWEEGIAYAKRLWEGKGDPKRPENAMVGWRSDRDIAVLVLAHLEDHDKGHPPPDIKTVEKRLRPVLVQLRTAPGAE
jgi:hypothetical protein